MKLNDIQQKLKAPKSQYNSFGKYHYRNAEDILEAVKPLLGAAILTLSDEIVSVGDRYYIKTTASFDNQDGKEPVSVTAFAREAFDRKGMDDSQITGAASSYARKYALNGLFLIDDTKDADSNETPPQPRQNARGAAKPAETGKDAATALKAAKDRTISLLGLLGHTDLKTKKEYEDRVFDLTGFILADKDIEAINEKLAALVEQNDAQK
jgi:ERF superfamily